MAAAAAPAGRPSTAPHAALKSSIAATAQAADAASKLQQVPGAPGEQLQMRVNYQDLDPVAQAQLAKQQLGIDPNVMQEQGMAAVQGAQQQAQAGAPADQLGIPPQLAGAGIPPGVESFPHDMAALMQMIHVGYAPGASAMEHAQAQNAHAIARAQEGAYQQSAQNQQQHTGASQQLGGILQQLVMHGAPPAAAAPMQVPAGQ